MGESVMFFGRPMAAAYLHAPREPSGFVDFWQAYPRKVGKGAARPAFIKAMRKTSLDVILNALVHTQWPADPQYIPYPATWLNRESWDDEPPEQIDHVARILGI